MTSALASSLAKADNSNIQTAITSGIVTHFIQARGLETPANCKKAALAPQDPGLWVYQTETDSLVPMTNTLEHQGERLRTNVYMNTLVAKAYYGGKVWEAELSAKPQNGTGFFKYITPKGLVVWFPMCWIFGSCPGAFFLAASLSEADLGVEVSYYNVYAGLAEMANTAVCDTYFRVYETGAGDVTQKAQLVLLDDNRVTLTPEFISDSASISISIETISTDSGKSCP